MALMLFHFIAAVASAAFSAACRRSALPACLAAAASTAVLAACCFAGQRAEGAALLVAVSFSECALAGASVRKPGIRNAARRSSPFAALAGMGLFLRSCEDGVAGRAVAGAAGSLAGCAAYRFVAGREERGAGRRARALLLAVVAALAAFEVASAILSPGLPTGWVAAGGALLYGSWLAVPFLLLAYSAVRHDEAVGDATAAPEAGAATVFAAATAALALCKPGPVATLTVAVLASFAAARGRFSHSSLAIALVPVAVACLAAPASWLPFEEWLNTGRFFWESCSSALDGASLFGAGAIDGEKLRAAPSWSADFVAAEIVSAFGLAGLASGLAAFASAFAAAAEFARSDGANLPARAAILLASVLLAPSVVSLAGLFLPLPMAGAPCPFLSDGATTALWSFAAAGASCSAWASSSDRGGIGQKARAWAPEPDEHGRLPSLPSEESESGRRAAAGLYCVKSLSTLGMLTFFRTSRLH